MSTTDVNSSCILTGMNTDTSHEHVCTPCRFTHDRASLMHQCCCTHVHRKGICLRVDNSAALVCKSCRTCTGPEQRDRCCCAGDPRRQGHGQDGWCSANASSRRQHTSLGAVLITGGLGALGSLLATWLAKRSASNCGWCLSAARVTCRKAQGLARCRSSSAAEPVAA